MEAIKKTPRFTSSSFQICQRGYKVGCDAGADLAKSLRCLFTQGALPVGELRA